MRLPPLTPPESKPAPGSPANRYREVLCIVLGFVSAGLLIIALAAVGRLVAMQLGRTPVRATVVAYEVRPALKANKPPHRTLRAQLPTNDGTILRLSFELPTTVPAFAEGDPVDLLYRQVPEKSGALRDEYLINEWRLRWPVEITKLIAAIIGLVAARLLFKRVSVQTPPA